MTAVYELISVFAEWKVTAVCVVTIVIFLTIMTRRRQGMPPGPPSYPLIGCIGQFNPRTIDKDINRFRTKYGDLFSLMVANRPLIFLNGYENVKELFLKRGEISSDRPRILLNEVLTKEQGIIGVSGRRWKEQRTFALTTLRSFGFGKRCLEKQIVDEISVFLDNIDSTAEKPFDLYEILSVSISNVICSIAFGQHFEHSDKRFQNLLFMLKEFIRLSAFTNVVMLMPVLRYIPGDLFGVKASTKIFNDIVEFIREIVEEHRQTFDENEIRDYIDAFLVAQKKNEGDPESTFTDGQLLHTVRDLFFAGTETTTTTLRWAVLFLIRNPEIQTKMRQEIDRVIGTSQLPSLNHKPELPYCEAVISEVQRRANIVPIGVVHSVTEDVNFNGYVIPKDALIFTNMNSILNDPDSFPDPESFDPDRFLSEDGKFVLPEKMIPFGIGRRVCLGESLAKMELFLFLVSLVQRFELLPESDTKVPSSEGVLGITRSVENHKIRAIKRK